MQKLHKAAARYCRQTYYPPEGGHLGICANG